MLKSRVLTTDGMKDITAYDADEFNFAPLEWGKKKRRRKTIEYAAEYICLDTETSHDENYNAWIYQWAIKFNHSYAYGRRPSDLIRWMRRAAGAYQLSESRKILLFIHNASYDLQFLKCFLRDYDPDLEVLATDAHHIISFDVRGFRILCSYKLSNLNLDLFSKNYAEHYRKMVGEIDYSIRHYQDEPLSRSNWEYQFSDVASQHDAIRGLLRAHGYEHIYDAPMTATGFVRNDCRNASRAELFWRKVFSRSRLSLEQYNLCRQGFMGGLTICSYKYVGETVRGLIGHRDFTSSYPARQMLDYFPEGAPAWYGDVETPEELDEVCATYACVFILHVRELRLKHGITAPYIPSSKLIYPKNGKGVLKLNGKVIFAEEMAIALTEVDYKWVKRQYTWDKDSFSVDKVLVFHRGELPQFLKENVMKYFKNKCTKKHSDPRVYLSSKGLLNAIYGMTASRIVRENYKYNEDMILTEQSDPAEKQLDDYYNSRNSFLPYQYSLWVTAWARDALMTMIECVGYDRFLYCDTDSVFYIKNDETEKALEAYNDVIRARAKVAGAFYGDSVLGVADKEPDLTAFRGLHAKCYAMIENGELKVTIAGIPKKSKKWIRGDGFTMLYEITNAQELGNIDRLDDDFMFKHCGGTRAIYVEGEPCVMNIHGHDTELASGVIIEDIEKEINETMFMTGKKYELLHVKYEEIL